MNKPKLGLKPCPFCGEVPVEGYRLGADWHECESGEVYISCSSPKHEGMTLLVYGKNFEQAANAWNRRAPLPDNKALTLEELRGMSGQPVWCEDNTIEAGIIRMVEDWSTEQMEAHIWTFDVEGNAHCNNVRLMLEFGAKFYPRQPGREDR